MIKNEKELQTWFKNYLNDNGIYARKLETPFARGWSDIYTAYNKRVDWVELKWLNIMNLHDPNEIMEKASKLPTPLQRKFLSEQDKNGIGAHIITGYYDEQLCKKIKPKFALESYPWGARGADWSIDDLLKAIWLF